eukprot:scaffold34685_cov183-Amphora_coffeaeformis.AAC.14
MRRSKVLDSFKWIIFLLGVAVLLLVLTDRPGQQLLLVDVDSKNLTFDDKESSFFNFTSSSLLSLNQDTIEVETQSKTASNNVSAEQQSPLQQVVDGDSNNSHTNHAPTPGCSWWNNGSEWGDGGEFSSLLKQAHDNAPATFAGKSVLVIGGSTSRDLAAYFLRMVLPPHQRDEVTRRWNANHTEGYQLFPPIGKHAKLFKLMYKGETMQPLMDAGWKFQRIEGPEAGCSDCKSSYTNLDYVASLRGGAYGNSSNGISYEFSWKPDIFAPRADTVGFQTRYCKRRYDVVHIGRGLHDAAFQPMNELTPDRIRERFLRLAELVQCFPPTTLVVLRTPYLSTSSKSGANVSEESLIVTISNVLKALVREGAFGSRRSVLMDGHLLTSRPDHPVPFDGHHYATTVSQTYLNLVTLAADVFFRTSAASRLDDFLHETTRQWQPCGLVGASDPPHTV